MVPDQPEFVFRLDPDTEGTEQMSSTASPRAKTFALILLAATQFVVVLDASIVNVALPVDRRRPELLAATTSPGS